MSASQTAAAVLQWALLPDGPPPSGDLDQLETLLQPEPALRQLLGQLAATALARLGLSPQPQPLDLQALCLAAAIGASRHPAALDLLRLCKKPSSDAQHALHHALVQACIQKLPTSFLEELLLISPLTALLCLPPKGGEDPAIRLCEQLAQRPSGRRMLVHRFADPSALPVQLNWRAHIFEALRTNPAFQPFILDVYEAAVALHAQAWIARIRQAQHLLASPQPGESALQLAIATGRWWEAFLALYRNDHQAIRERRYLNDFELYLAGIRLAQTTQNLRKGH